MNRRTKILTALFAVVIGYVAVSRAVYPAWIKPFFSLDARIAERGKELARLEALADEVEKARWEYRGCVERIGTFDVGRVEMDVRDRLNGLIEKYKLQSASVAPSRPVEDRKTGLTATVITVSAVGTLESAVNFLKEVSELPELVRVGNPTMYPTSSGRKGADKDLVNVRVPVEVLVLPQQTVVGRIDLTELKKPETFVRHAERDYSPIWKGTPFTEFVPLAPLRVDVQRTITVETGQPAGLQATPSGGDGNYTIAWSPADGLVDPMSPHPTLDTSTARTQTYTVTVADGAESKPATASVAVTIREPKPVEPPPDQPAVVLQIVDTGPQRWPDARFMQIVMTLLRSVGPDRTNELMVYNTRTKETTYYRSGADFDGGTLVFVHQTGGLVHRKGQYFVYPLGGTLEDHLEASAAGGYPELKAAVERAEVGARARAEAEALAKAVEDPQKAVIEQPAKNAEAVERSDTADEKAEKAGPDPMTQATGDNGSAGAPAAATMPEQKVKPAAPTPQIGADEADSEAQAKAADGAEVGPPTPETKNPDAPGSSPGADRGNTAKSGQREAPKKKPLLHRPSRAPKRAPGTAPGRL